MTFDLWWSGPYVKYSRKKKLKPHQLPYQSTHEECIRVDTAWHSVFRCPESLKVFQFHIKVHDYLQNFVWSKLADHTQITFHEVDCLCDGVTLNWNRKKYLWVFIINHCKHWFIQKLTETKITKAVDIEIIFNEFSAVQSLKLKKYSYFFC